MTTVESCQDVNVFLGLHIIVKLIRAHFLKFLSDFISFYKMAGSFKMASKKWKQTKLSPGFPDINLQFIQRSRDCVSMLHGCCLQYNSIKDPRNGSHRLTNDNEYVSILLVTIFFFLNCSNLRLFTFYQLAKNYTPFRNTCVKH